MTVLDLITRAMRLLGAYNVGDDAPEAAEEQAGLMALNAMVDAWGLERLMMFTSAGSIYQTVSGKASYTIGPNGADWTAPRPLYIDAVTVIVPGTPSTYERPLHIIETNREWARVRMKALPSTLYTAVYYQPDFPNGTLAFWPAPQNAQQVVLYTPTQVSQFTTLNQVISLPPGYARALPYNLAVELAPEFSKTPSQLVLDIASGSKERIKGWNVLRAMGRLRCDPALTMHDRGGNWDWMIGEPR